MIGLRVVSESLINRQLTSSFRPVVSCCEFQYFCSRKFSSKENKKLSAMEELKENYKPIYRFPKIRIVAALNKLKNYQLAATVFGVPVTYFVFPEHLFTVGYLGSTLICSLGFISYLLKDSIGAMYIHKNDPNIVRIAYINFWGSRNDVCIKVDNIVPFSDLPNSLTNKLYTKLKFNNGQEDLKLLSREVEILDDENFSRIFGY